MQKVSIGIYIPLMSDHSFIPADQKQNFSDIVGNFQWLNQLLIFAGYEMFLEVDCPAPLVTHRLNNNQSGSITPSYCTKTPYPGQTYLQKISYIITTI